MTKKYDFILPMSVRDYECDVEGIVNNANYLHYLEHTRHQFLRSEGVSFIELHENGIDCVVARINIAFKTPLHSDECFNSCLRVRHDGLKYVFFQDIYRESDGKLVIRATVDTVCIVNGRLSPCRLLDNVFSKYFSNEKNTPER